MNYYATKKIDSLGRVTILKAVREKLRIAGGDEIEIYWNENGEIMLKKKKEC